MAEKITIVCPACFAKLNLSDPAKLGKKIKCPKCQEVITAEQNDGEDEDDEPKSPSGRKRATGKSKGSSKKSAKGKSAESRPNVPLIVGGVALLAVVGIGLYLSGVFGSKPVAAPAAAPVAAAPTQEQAPTVASTTAASSPVATAPVTTAPDRPAATPVEKTLGLRWMPEETDLIVHAKLSDIWQAPSLKGLSNDPGMTARIKEFEKLLGVGPADVESVTIGFVDLMGSTLKSVADIPVAPIPVARPLFRPEDSRFIGVVMTKKPVDLKLIAASIPNAKMLERSGKSYLDIPPMFPGDAARGAWSPEPNTIITATTKELFAAMDRGETVVPRKEFASIDPLPQVLIAAAVRAVSQEEIQLFDSREREMPALFVGATKLNQELGLQMGEIGLTIKGGFDLKVIASSRTIEGASKLKFKLEELVGQAKAAFAAFEKTAPPLIAELGQILVTKLNVGMVNEVVSVSTGIPDSEQAKLEQLPAIVMMMAVTGGFNNLGGPPDAAIGNAEKSAFVPRPFETEGVDATKVEGLPDGWKLSAKTAWVYIDAGLESGLSLEILIDVTGDSLESICGVSRLRLKTLTPSDGANYAQPLLKTGNRAVDPLTIVNPFDSKDLTSVDHPPRTLRLRVANNIPTRLIKVGTVDLLEGTFKILTSTDSKEFSIDEVPKRIKRPPTDPDMKALEIKLRRGPTGVTPESITVSCGKDHLLGTVVGTPGDIISVTEVEKDQTVQRLISNHEGGKFPDDFQIEFTVHPQVKEQTVTFRVEKVRLPARAGVQVGPDGAVTFVPLPNEPETKPQPKPQ